LLVGSKSTRPPTRTRDARLVPSIKSTVCHSKFQPRANFHAQHSQKKARVSSFHTSPFHSN
jgi:hypothetical protein